MYSIDTQMRIRLAIDHLSPDEFYIKLVRRGFGFSECMLFDSCGYNQDRFYEFDWLCFAEAKRWVSWDEIRHCHAFGFRDWIGFLLAYDFKNTLLGHLNKKDNLINTPESLFFTPRWVFYSKNQTLFAEFLPEDYEAFSEVLDSILGVKSDEEIIARYPNYQPIISKESYISNFYKIQEHLYRGDIYEMNYCVYYFSNEPLQHIPEIWLNKVMSSRAPMSGLFKFENIAIISHSPERFFTIKEGRIYSQPIKGTIKRATNELEDERLKAQLLESKKERAENVMIVDLVRNDLSRICEAGTIHVDELFSIRSFASVHQMISTISGRLCQESDYEDIFTALFPMGSMTGAPKFSAMNIICSLETHSRGIYSGTAGYISPEGNIDCNVMIRSVISDLKTGQSYIGVGSAVTVYANAEDEYEECLLKLSSVIR